MAHRPPTPVAQPNDMPKVAESRFESGKTDDEDHSSVEKPEAKAAEAKSIVRPDARGTEGGEEDEDAISIPRISPARIPRPPALLASPPRRSYKDLLELQPANDEGESGRRETSDGPDVDDIPAGMGDADPLFTFDDEGETDWIDEDGSNETSGRQLGNRSDAKDEPGDAQEESPMAGSLPIEIRWPGRRS